MCPALRSPLSLGWTVYRSAESSSEFDASSRDSRLYSYTNTYLRQFFVVFVFWGVLLSVWLFATLVGLNAHAASTRPNFEVDPQLVVVAALYVSFSVHMDVNAC